MPLGKELYELKIFFRGHPVMAAALIITAIATAVSGMTMQWMKGQFFETKGPQPAMLIVGLALILALVIFSGVVYSAVKRPQPHQIV